MNKLNLDVLLKIFSYLTPKEQAKISRTCKKFYQVCNLRGDYTINPVKHRFYQYIGHLRINIFKVKDIKKNYIIFDDRKKKKIQRDNNGIPYYRALLGNGFIFRYELSKLDKLFKKYCDYCQKLKYCINHFKTVNCIVCTNNCLCDCKTCNRYKQYFHSHYIYKSCFKTKYPKTINKNFKKLQVIKKFC